MFHDDVGKLYNEILKMDPEESIGMVQEQTLKYFRAFGSHQVKSPGTKLGRPPSQGNPGFNPDLMVMDLVKLRTNPTYKSMIHELKVDIHNPTFWSIIMKIVKERLHGPISSKVKVYLIV